MTNVNNNNQKALKRRIKQHVISKQHNFFLICHPGFENQVVQELQDLYINTILTAEPGGVEITGKLDTCYIVNTAMRKISRCLMRLFDSTVYNFAELYRKINNFPWELYIKKTTTLEFSVSCKKSKLYHTDKIEQVCNDATSTRLNSHSSDITLSDQDTKAQQQFSQKIFIRINDNSMQCSLDCSGELLYKRGIKTHSAIAGLRETLAASILLASNIHKYNVLYDPMCGSGNFSIESLMIHHSMLPNEAHKFAFYNWPAFKEANYKYVINNIKSKVAVNPDFSTITTDINPKEISTTELNINDFKPAKHVSIFQDDFLHSKVSIPLDETCLIIMNPPYGKRLSATTTSLYKNIGHIITQKFSHCSYAIIVPDAQCEKSLNLPYDDKISSNNGGIKVTLLISHTALKN